MESESFANIGELHLSCLSDRCGHCKNLAPEYEKPASVLSRHDPPIALAKVDADAEEYKGLAEKFEIQGFPTIKILKNGGEVVQDYKGPRKADGIV
ncbi:hypothetical protein L1987_69336 [Smallanthus sonchifolius]|uniref:Uncharacterized protein n=1 Tax=Smallanthus sonchifolius TaxID=185202 RepID=A0ACB9B6Q9_9ASTR|nr:hypothetical protein L1987_69336 [Smallanthus sonchifolius]